MGLLLWFFNRIPHIFPIVNLKRGPGGRNSAALPRSGPPPALAGKIPLTNDTVRCIVLRERGYDNDRPTAQAGTPGHLRALAAAAGGLLRLSDHQGPLRLHRDLGVDPLPDPAPAGGGRKPHRLLCGAQRAAAQVLPRHPGRHRTDRPVFVRVAGDRTCLSSDKGVCRI